MVDTGHLQEGKNTYVRTRRLKKGEGFAWRRRILGNLQYSHCFSELLSWFHFTGNLKKRACTFWRLPCAFCWKSTVKQEMLSIDQEREDQRSWPAHTMSLQTIETMSWQSGSFITFGWETSQVLCVSQYHKTIKLCRRELGWVSSIKQNKIRPKNTQDQGKWLDWCMQEDAKR